MDRPLSFTPCGKAHGRRHVILSDSMCWHCAVAKGRFSIWSVRRRCLELCALSNASDAPLLSRWIPSEINPVDAPSRRFEKSSSHSVALCSRAGSTACSRSARLDDMARSQVDQTHGGMSEVAAPRLPSVWQNSKRLRWARPPGFALDPDDDIECDTPQTEPRPVGPDFGIQRCTSELNSGNRSKHWCATSNVGVRDDGILDPGSLHQGIGLPPG